MLQLKTTLRGAPRLVPLEDPSRPPRLRRGRALPLASLLLLPPTRHLPTTGSFSQRPLTRPSPVFAATLHYRDRLPTAHLVSHSHPTSTMFLHSKRTTAYRLSQMSFPSLSTLRGTTTVLGTPRTQTTNLPCHLQGSLLHIQSRLHLRRGRANTSRLKRLFSHCLAVVRTSCLDSSTTAATSPLHHHLQCPRMANRRTLLTQMSSAVAARGDAAATSMNGTMEPRLLVVKHPVSGRSEKVVTRRRHNKRRRKSSLAYAQERGICSTRNARPRPTSNSPRANSLLAQIGVYCSSTTSLISVPFSELSALLTITLFSTSAIFQHVRPLSSWTDRKAPAI